MIIDKNQLKEENFVKVLANLTVAPRPSSVVIISSVNIHKEHHTKNNRKILEMQEFKKLSMVQKDAAARLCCYCSVLAWMC